MLHHSLATVLRATKTDVADIQNLCDHTDPTTAEIYTTSLPGRPLIPI